MRSNIFEKKIILKCIYGFENEVQNEGQFLTNLHVKVNKFEKKYKDLKWGREFKNVSRRGPWFLKWDPKFHTKQSTPFQNKVSNFENTSIKVHAFQNKVQNLDKFTRVNLSKFWTLFWNACTFMLVFSKFETLFWNGVDCFVWNFGSHFKNHGPLRETFLNSRPHFKSLYFFSNLLTFTCKFVKNWPSFWTSFSKPYIHLRMIFFSKMLDLIS